ncbi:hypothetical protein [Pontibacterium sp.]|uniref:hypothetical protein n=1 Tax=Pontibacterium sp. TaxID=2036026 RepID=UPI003564FB0A
MIGDKLADIDRILIVQRQWLDLIFQGIKPWELRTSGTRVRGWIALAESGSGLVVGKAKIVDSLQPLDPDAALDDFDKHQVSDPALLAKWRYPWVMEGAQRFIEPIRYNHPPGAVIWVRIKDGVLVDG